MPYLSVIAASRNDNHGGRLLERTQIFLDSLAAQARRFKLPVELLLVEWNPPADRPGLQEALQWPASDDFFQARLLSVAPEIHQRYKLARGLPLYQMIAKNVAIRRARGEYLLASNIDILFSDELFAFLARRPLQPDRVYRMERWDVDQDVPLGADIQTTLAYCRNHLIRVWKDRGTLPLTPTGQWRRGEWDITPPEAPILLGSGWGEPKHHLFGFDRPGRWVLGDAEILIDWPQNQSQTGFLALEIALGPSSAQKPVHLVLRDQEGRTRGEADLLSSAHVAFPLTPRPGQREVFHLCSDSLALPLPRHPKRLNLAVFQLDWQLHRPAPASVPAPAAEIPLSPELQLGTGWSSCQARAQGPRRWMVAAESEFPLIRTTPSPLPRVLELELAPGPDLENATHTLQLINARTGQVVDEKSFEDAGPLRLILPAGSDRDWLLHIAHPKLAPGPRSGLLAEVFACRLKPLTADELPAKLQAPPASWSYPRRAAAVGPAAVFTNACGDFTLMARKNWLELQGYPELDAFSLHIDTLFCILAHHAGLPTEVLEEPMRIYHIEHSPGSGDTPEGRANLNQRLKQAGIQEINYMDVLDFSAILARWGCGAWLNASHWGLAQEKIPEWSPPTPV